MHPIHHAESSAKKWGGTAEEYLLIHEWFDETKALVADFRHRALRHHAEGIFMCERIFGPTLTLSTGRQIPVRWIGEQHMKEDFAGRIPSAVDWLRAIKPEPWMSPRSTAEVRVDCQNCGGKGEVLGVPCSWCKGTGKLPPPLTENS